MQNRPIIDTKSEPIFQKVIKPEEGEFFKRINDYGTILSNYGRVFRSGTAKLFKPSMGSGYPRVRIGEHETASVARLVVNFFLKEIKKSDIVLFKDGNVLNCRLDNLKLKPGGNKKFVDLTGRKFGRLTALEPDHNYNESFLNKSQGWKCLCDCGNIISTAMQRLKTGDSKSCGCLFEEKIIRRGFGDMPNSYWSEVLSNAKVRNLKVEITAEQAWNKYVEQKGKCALTGWPLYFGVKSKTKEKKIKGVASLDRIDSKLGYTLDNVQWLHTDINRMKLHFNQDYFLKACRDITKNKQ